MPPGGRRQAAKGEGLRAAAAAGAGEVSGSTGGGGGGGGDAPHAEQAGVPPRSMTVGPGRERPTEAAGAG